MTQVALLLSGPSSNSEFTSSHDLFTSLNSEIPTSEQSGTRHRPNIQKLSKAIADVIILTRFCPLVSHFDYTSSTTRHVVYCRKTLCHPQNRKYITYCIIVRGNTSSSVRAAYSASPVFDIGALTPRPQSVTALWPVLIFPAEGRRLSWRA